MPTDPRPVALITGAARRIGAEIARTLHAAGYDLVLHYRHSATEMHALCAELDGIRANSTLSVQAELANTQELPALVEATIKRFGRLDALINNASTFYATPLAEATPAQWDELFASNARAPFFLAQAAAQHLRESRGAIVNVADIYGLHPTADLGPYAASKASLLSVTQSLALALAPNVRVNALALGAIEWPETSMNTARKAQILESTALARAGAREDVANAVKWLLSGACFTTGHVLRVDGGRNLAG